MINTKDRANCCGCSACSIVCPFDAISMSPDSMGFIYPEMSIEKCKDCGLCNRVCSLQGKYEYKAELSSPKIMAARHKDETELMKSRSGALFLGLSDVILSQGGVIYGAAFDSCFRVKHIRATTAYERDLMRGSKYVQSDIAGIFTLVKQDLEKGLSVLFSGTPCQTASLDAFLKYQHVDESKLLKVDIVCHGVPAPNVWRDYLKYIEKKYKDRIIKADFRDKDHHGWAAHLESFLLEKKGWISMKSYTYLFHKHIMFRPACAECHYTSFNRPSDITLGDFWGWENDVPDMNKDDKGISLVLVNSPKGIALIDQIRDKYDIRDIEALTYIQPNLKASSVFDPNWRKFETEYSNKGFEFVAKKYGDLGVNYLVKRFRQKTRTALRIVRKKMGVL